MLEVDIVLQGRYQIVRQIGKGGMGAVYLAQDLRLGSRVALKETFFTDETLLKAFEREARLLASLRHAALPKVSDHFIEGEGQFLVMEYIPGEDLSEMLGKRDAPFPAEEVLAWADQLLDALDYLHTRTPPVIHRDIKPQNLKLTDRDQIVLLDFGLAKGSAAGMTRASTYSIFGYTPSYAPLEQMQATGTDARSDLYSLAATLYHLLTAVAPPDSMKRANAVLNKEEDPLRPASEINPFVLDSVSCALARAMSLNRNERHLTASEMRKALRRADSFNYVTGLGTEIIDQRPTSSERTAAPTQANESDRRTQGSPQSEITVPETVVAAPISIDHIAQKDSPAPARSKNWVATFNRKWAMATVIVALIAGGATLAVLNFQPSGSVMEAPVAAPPPAQSVQPDASLSAPPANSNTAVENQYANEKSREPVRRESNANARKTQPAEKPKAEPEESPKAQTPAKRTGPLRRLRRMMTRKDS
ncbi:MAG: serine/threonine-protein kinase [Acidobacteriota bacterium]